MGVSVKKLLPLLLSTLVVTGCAQSTEFGEVSSSIRDSQEMQAETDTSQPSVESEAADTDENQVLEADKPSEDQQVERAESTPAPITYEFASELVDDEICKLEEDSYPRRTWSDVPASAFPLNTFGKTISSFGTTNMQVIYLEWEDLRGTQGDYDYHVKELDIARNFLRVVSEGNFNLNVIHAPEWSLVEGSYQDFYTSDEYADATNKSQAHLQFLVDSFIEATDSTVDYTDVDVLFFAFPREEMVVQGNGMHIFGKGGLVTADTNEGTVVDMFSLGSRVYDHAYGNPGWSSFVHEFSHSLNMPDLRDWSDGKDQLRGDDFKLYLVNPMYGLDIMDVQGTGTQGLSGWMKWLQGWLNDSQVTCVDATTVDREYYRLDQSNLMNADNEMLVVRLSETKALAIESRRWDSRFDLPVQNSRDGVIVYVVDATRGHAEGPLKLLSPRDVTKYLSQDGVWPDWRMLDVILFEGDSVSFDGITVQVERLSDDGDAVLITTSRS